MDYLDRQMVAKHTVLTLHEIDTLMRLIQSKEVQQLQGTIELKNQDPGRDYQTNLIAVPDRASMRGFTMRV